MSLYRNFTPHSTDGVWPGPVGASDVDFVSGSVASSGMAVSAVPTVRCRPWLGHWTKVRLVWCWL